MGIQSLIEKVYGIYHIRAVYSKVFVVILIDLLVHVILYMWLEASTVYFVEL